MERLRLVAGAILHAFCASSGKADPDEVHRWVQLLPLGSKGMLYSAGPRTTKFTSLEEAYWSWCPRPRSDQDLIDVSSLRSCLAPFSSPQDERKIQVGSGGNLSGRMSQASFMRATRELQFGGDAKLVWARPFS